MLAIDEEIPSNFLSVLWRRIALMDGLIPYLTGYVSDYVHSMNVRTSNHKKIITRTNLVKKISDPNLSWKVFTFILIQVVKVRNSKMTITFSLNGQEKKYESVGDNLSQYTLSELWIDIMKDLTNIDELITECSKETGDKKSNINKKVYMNIKSSMTWNVFTYLLEHIAKITKFEIEINATYRDSILQRTNSMEYIIKEKELEL